MIVPPFDRYRVTLRMTAPGRFRFCHGGVLMGLLCRVLGKHDLPAGLIPFPSESGRVRFEPGDAYAFGLTLVGNAREHARTIEDGLRRAGTARHDPNAPPPRLGGNFDVESFEALPEADIEGEAAALRGSGEIRLRFVSPFRLERPKSLRARGARYLNGDCFPAGHFLARLHRRVLFLGRDPASTSSVPDAPIPPIPETTETRDLQLLWIDMPVEGSSGKDPSRPKGYTLGGVQGSVTLVEVPDEWLPTLAAGRYLHVGERTHFGFGAYRIAVDRTLEEDSFRSSRSFLEEAADPEMLDNAVDHLVARSIASGVDGVSPADFAEERVLHCNRAARDLMSGACKSSPFLGVLVPKKDGRVRPLAIPTARDRVIQRTVAGVVGPSVDSLLEDCSYAYRKGFSRAGAARAIERAYREGFRYVLDADVESFFDAVDWKRMFAKLDALFPFDPIIPMIEEWVRAPVVFDGRTITRDRGLPQGSPLSPLLANLFLDEFDEELLERDYRLIRYADDFIVLGKDRETVIQAREDARRALAKLGLSLSDRKTSIGSFDDGFHYLGYLFCRSVVLEEENKDGSPALPVCPSAGDVPPLSWLAGVPLERVGALVRRGQGEARKRPVEIVPLVAGRPALTALQRPLYITSPHTGIRLRKETLIITSPGSEEVKLPIRTVSHLVLAGRNRATLPALLSLSRRGVPVYFCSRSGELEGMLTPDEPDWNLWMTQAEFTKNEESRVRFSREIVAAKLHNQATLAVRFRFTGYGDVAREIRDLERGCAGKTKRESLRGMEGKGAALYFGALRESLDRSWGFEGRKAHPSPDPVNVLLSFGYSMLHNHLATDLTAAGLNPRIGIYHEARGKFAALAADLQEEFRYLVDALVWAMIRRREIGPDDFTSSSSTRYPCLLLPDPRRRFLASFERRIGLEFTPPGGEPIPYREFMNRQARSVREWIAGRSVFYEPLRAHS